MTAPRWRIHDARAPACLLGDTAGVADREGFCRVNLTIANGRIARLVPAGAPDPDSDSPILARGGAIVVPGFVDAHTHLDKGHIWPRSANPDGTFAGAREFASADRIAHWTAADLRARMNFALECAYAHGTVAIRTHLDSPPEQIAISWPVFAEVRDQWRDRIALQASPLSMADNALNPDYLPQLLAAMRDAGTNVLGALALMSPSLPDALDRLFRTATEHGLDLDFHADETGDPAACGLALIAETAIRHRFQGRVLVGHCCSLAVQDDDTRRRTIARVAEAGLAVVSLPMCNLYLQDRVAGGAAPHTPRWRGVAPLHELKAAGVTVLVASDNTRDPFYAYGDLDMVEVWREATRILHLDHAGPDWPAAVTAAPAKALGLSDHHGRLAEGCAADLVLFSARSWTELFARPQSDRIVVRNGKRLAAPLPPYASLDGLVGAPT